MNSYPRETNDFQPVILELGGVRVTVAQVGSVKLSDVPDGSRPLVWTDPVVFKGALGVAVAGYGPGKRRVFAKVTENPFAPALDCGTYLVT